MTRKSARHGGQSLVSGGCIISGTEIRRFLLFTGVHTNSYAASMSAGGAALRDRRALMRA
jgi:ADP-glucose pyrophosphorylase